MKKYAEKKALVLGLGISGKSAAYYLLDEGASLLCVDKNLESLHQDARLAACSKVLDGDEIDLHRIDFIVKSPGISFQHPLIVNAQRENIKILSEMQLACMHLLDSQKKLLAITGSNGKTTTTLLTTHILQKCGIKAVAVGNIGLPLLSQIQVDADVFVVELSSFQLEHLHLPVFDAGVILNISPNHLDRYSTYLDYVKAKLQLEHCLKREAKLFMNEITASHFGHLLTSNHVHRFSFIEETIESIFPLGYRGGEKKFSLHDFENLQAACTLCRECGICEREAVVAAYDFKKPPHRIEYVAKVDGVDYINDSKATSVDAVIKAVESLEGPLILIVGGVDKGGSYADWISSFKEKVKKVLAIGQASLRMEKEIGSCVSVEKLDTLDKAFYCAVSLAKTGDTVLLSPGCSSYDQFRDYQERGDHFKQLVGSLKGRDL